MKKITISSLVAVIVMILFSVPSVMSISAEQQLSPIVYSDENQLMGDVNGDGIVSIMDATDIQMHLADIKILSDDMISRAKVLGNDEVSVLDVTAIQRYLALLDNFGNTGDLIEKPTETVQHTVMFKDYDGTILSSQIVSDGGEATVPNAPVKDGYTFLGWSGNYIDVVNDEVVKAVYSDEKNVFIVESVSCGLNETVNILVSLDGVVKTCGFDLRLLYDSGLELVSYDSDLDLDIVANENAIQNGIVMNFSSASDKKKQRDVVELTFKIKDSTKTNFPVTLNVKSIKEVSGINIVNADYIVVNGLVKRK